MVLKPTNISSNFFPSRTRGGEAKYATEDAPVDGHNGLARGGSNNGTAAQMQTAGFAPTAARGNEGSIEKVEAATDDKIILVDWDGRE